MLVKRPESTLVKYKMHNVSHEGRRFGLFDHYLM